MKRVEGIAERRARQNYRIRRFFLASVFSLLYVVALVVCGLAGVIAWPAVKLGSALTALCIATFYTAFRTDLNLRYRDPSLTGIQLAAASLTMLMVVLADPNGREPYGPFLFVAYMFGMLRLSTRVLGMFAAATQAGHAAIVAFHILRDGAFHGHEGDVVTWIIVSIAMPWLILVGGYVRRLRSDLERVSVRLEDIEEEARRDELTGVYNRRALMAALASERNRSERFAEPFALCIIDLDHFKAINDAGGHLCGDEVLRRFATTLGSVVRVTDVFGRYGGEEFLQVLTGTTLDGALVHAERIRILAEQIDLVGLPDGIRVTVSVGVAEHTPGESVTETLERADAALYLAKRSGRNCVRGLSAEAGARSPVGAAA